MVNHQHDQHAAVDLAVMLKLVGISELKAAAVGQLRQRIGQRLAPQCFGALAFLGKDMVQAGRQGIHSIDHDLQQGGDILTGQTRRACIPDAQGMVYDFLQRSPQAAGRERPSQRSATRCNQQCRQRRMTGQRQRHGNAERQERQSGHRQQYGGHRGIAGQTVRSGHAGVSAEYIFRFSASAV